jgi:hypothetical protein
LGLIESVWSLPSISIPPLLNEVVQALTPLSKVVLFIPKNGVEKLAVLPRSYQVPPRLLAHKARK